MRRLMWFTIGYALASGVGTYLLRGPWLLLGAAAIGAAVYGLRRYWEHPVGKRAILAAIGFAAGCLLFFGYEWLVLRPIAGVGEQKVSAAIRVTDCSWETEYGSAADGVMELGGRSYKVRFYLNDRRELEPGDLVQLQAQLRLTDEGGAREPTFHRTSGILLLAYQRGDAEVIDGAPTWRDWPALWRWRLTEIIGECFPEDTFAFAKALLLGDKSDMTWQQSREFSLSGISHIVAVSGLHVSILCTMLLPIFRRRRFLTAVFVIPMLFGFAAVVGFAPSVTRAVIMQSLMLLAVVFDREYDPPTALSFACLVILARCPLTIASVGFQLSVASVAGIFLFYASLDGWMKQWFPGKGRGLRGRMERWFTSSVAVTLSATVMTVPLTAIYFGVVSLVGVVTNLLVLFAVSGIFYGVGLVCILGAVSTAAGTALAWAVSWPIRYVLAVARALAQVPMGAVFTVSPYIVLWLVLVYGLLLWMVLTEQHPGVMAGLAALGLSISMMLSFLEPLVCDYRVTVLDVGQGQCLVLQSEGSTFLVDCGGSRGEEAADIAAEYLLSQGIRRVDGLILTHYDRDHAGGVPCLAQWVDIERVYLPGTEDADGCLQPVLDAVQEQIPIDTELSIAFGGAQIRIFPAKTINSGNDSCASVLFQRGKCDTLITGDLSADAERQLMADYDLPDLEVLIVGHHGSKYSTCPELLAATAPDAAIISVGENNGYGHPTPEVLERLKEAGCAVYRTDLHGTITYRG